MSYKVSLSDMQDLQLAYKGVIDEWQNGIYSVRSKAMVLENSNNISGNGADHMRSYLEKVYSLAEGMLTEVLTLFTMKFWMYLQDYYQNIDSSDNARIQQQELNERYEDLGKKRKTMAMIGGEADSLVASVSGVVSVPKTDFSNQDAEIAGIITSLNQLDTDITELESRHLSEDFTELDELLYRIESFLSEMKSLNKEFKVDFSIQSFAAVASVVPLLDAMEKGKEVMEAQKEEFMAAADSLVARIERQQAEMEERQQTADWIKTGVTIVAGLASAVAIATGVGTMLVPVIFGIAGGAINAVGKQYVEHNWDMEDWDAGYIGKEAIKGGVKGLVSALTGEFVPSEAALLNAGISGVESAVWGSLDEVYDQMAATGYVTDVQSVLFEGAKSGTSDFAQELVGDVIGDKVKKMKIGSGLDNYSAPSEDIRHYIGEGIRGGTKKVTSGIGKRFTEATVETGFDIGKNLVEGEKALEDVPLGERYMKVMALDEMGKDFVTGSQKGIAGSYNKEHTTDPKTGTTPIIQSALGKAERAENKADYSRTALTTKEEDLILEMDENGEFDLTGAKIGPDYYSSSTMKPLTEEPIEINFNANTQKYKEETFEEQLHGHELGLNWTSAADAVDRLEQFQMDGRADSEDFQKNQRYAAYESIFEEKTNEQISSIMAKHPKMSYEDASRRVNTAKIQKEAEKELKKMDALHDPDQNAGGDPANVHGFGSSSVNRSIGSQWGHGRADELYQKIRDATKGMSREELENTRLNIKLNYTVK